MLLEVRANELKEGDTIVAKQGGKQFKILSISPRIGGPYLKLENLGRVVEHDCSFDRYSATYTVERG